MRTRRKTWTQVHKEQSRFVFYLRRYKAISLEGLKGFNEGLIRVNVAIPAELACFAHAQRGAPRPLEHPVLEGLSGRVSGRTRMIATKFSQCEDVSE